MSKVMIYSNEHKGWWKPYYFGYTQCSKEAGIFDLEDAINKYPKLDYDTSNEDFLVDVSVESIKEANPSEALECLEFLFHQAVDFEHEKMYRQMATDRYTTIKQALLKAQEPKQYVDELKLVEKKLKALEIIKEKRVDIESFYTTFIEGDYDYSFYERRYGTYGKYCLTEEEFKLLKEVLE